MSQSDSSVTDPHAGGLLLTAGAELGQARGAVIMLHGRGAPAKDILSLVPALNHPRLAYLAPQASGRTWYPNRFIEPLASNEPWLSSALGVIASLLDRIEAAGIPRARTALLGFSQGACLVLEFAARNARFHGGVIGLSGGLIGPPGEPRHDRGNLDGTPIFLGCSDIDGHVPKEVVLDSATRPRIEWVRTASVSVDCEIVGTTTTGAGDGAATTRGRYCSALVLATHHRQRRTVRLRPLASLQSQGES